MTKLRAMRRLVDYVLRCECVELSVWAHRLIGNGGFRGMTAFGCYLLAALGEIAGCFAFWAWLGRAEAHSGPCPALSLIVFALALTRVDAGGSGPGVCRLWRRLYAFFARLALDGRWSNPLLASTLSGKGLGDDRTHALFARKVRPEEPRHSRCPHAATDLDAAGGTERAEWGTSESGRLT